jgi:hypothetical protein
MKETHAAQPLPQPGHPADPVGQQPLGGGQVKAGPSLQ